MSTPDSRSGRVTWWKVSLWLVGPLAAGLATIWIVLFGIALVGGFFQRLGGVWSRPRAAEFPPSLLVMLAGLGLVVALVAGVWFPRWMLRPPPSRFARWLRIAPGLVAAAFFVALPWLVDPWVLDGTIAKARTVGGDQPEAIKDLGRRASPRSCAALDALSAAGDQENIARAAAIVAARSCPGGAHIALRFVRDDHPLLRAAAAAALCAPPGNPHTRTACVRLARDPDAIVREATVVGWTPEAFAAIRNERMKRAGELARRYDVTDIWGFSKTEYRATGLDRSGRVACR